MAVSEADKIRKAEEIYYRRNGIRVENNEKKKRGFLGNFIKNIIIVAVIIGAVYAYENKDYLMSETFKSDLKKILNTKIDIQEIWNNFTNEKVQENEVKEKVEDEEVKEESAPEAVKEVVPISYTYIYPLKGVITSSFGYRTSSNPNVEGNHTGIDIAGNIGDTIVSSSYGKVIEVSGEGAYGNHLKIENEDIIMLYAHCSEILVSEGDVITQGEEIAKVGMTGNTTGPHLHFEIRKNNEPVNPLDYLEES